MNGYYVLARQLDNYAFLVGPAETLEDAEKFRGKAEYLACHDPMVLFIPTYIVVGHLEDKTDEFPVGQMNKEVEFVPSEKFVLETKGEKDG